MSFSVDGWDPTYGTSLELEDDLGVTSADVDVGAFLSGGVDSSAVVAAMAEVSSGPVRTFSIGFDDAAHDELPHARPRLGLIRLQTERLELVKHLFCPLLILLELFERRRLGCQLGVRRAGEALQCFQRTGEWLEHVEQSREG